MKKLLLIVPIVLLLVAACNQQQPVAQNTQINPPVQTSQTPPKVSQEASIPQSDIDADLKTYRNEDYGVEIKYPQTWYAYGDKSAFANPDLLSWRGFVPDYDANKSLEQQALLSIQIFNKNPNSFFDAPKRFITKIRNDEIWQQVTINNYPATRITNTTSTTVTDYVFEYDGRLYDFNASYPSLFDKILPTLEFTQTVSQTVKQSTYDLFKDIANWKIEEPASYIAISHCTDGTQHNPLYQVFSMSFDSGGAVSDSADTQPGASYVTQAVKTVLQSHGWEKCTPNDNQAGDYYSNAGPDYRETYIKNDKLLQLNTNYSMGVGNSVDVQFEYDK